MDLKQPLPVDHEPVATKHADYARIVIRSAAEAGLATAADRCLGVAPDDKNNASKVKKLIPVRGPQTTLSC